MSESNIPKKHKDWETQRQQFKILERVAMKHPSKRAQRQHLLMLGAEKINRGLIHPKFMNAAARRRWQEQVEFTV